MEKRKNNKKKRASPHLSEIALFFLNQIKIEKAKLEIFFF